MWKFSGSINYICDVCGDNDDIPIEDFNIDCIGGSERGMGQENIYEVRYDFDCPNCDNEISLNFEASEYPVEFLNFVLNNSTGAETTGEPDLEHIDDSPIYLIPEPEIIVPENNIITDLSAIHDTIPRLIEYLKRSPQDIHLIDPREFEEVIAEIFRDKGFSVALTPRTRDGGKDVIAIENNDLGIESKYFIECKRYSPTNKVGVDIVRSLYGVQNSRDSANKSIIATTSTFTSGARKFAEEETRSRWEMSLKDYSDVISWIDGYRK